MMSESMTQMPPVVLAPSQSQKLFEGQQQARVCEPIFYSARDESITRRVRRRLGVSCVRETVTARLGIVERRADVLDRIHVCWPCFQR